MKVDSNSKKEIFSEFRDNYLFTKEIKLSELQNQKIIDEIKTLKVIEIDDFKSFESYINYDHYLIFKKNDNFYFCDTELIPGLKDDSLIRIIDYNVYLRKDKIKRIQNEK